MPLAALVVTHSVACRASHSISIPLSLANDSPSLPHLEVLELLNLNSNFSYYPLIGFLRSRRPFVMANGKPSFKGPPDTLEKLKVTFKPTEKRSQFLDNTDVVQVLKRWCGVSVHVGPITYVD